MQFKSINELPPKKKNKLYLVAVITESGKKVVVTALCEYEKQRDKYFWEIQHTFYDIIAGKIVGWAEIPKFPKELLNEEV